MTDDKWLLAFTSLCFVGCLCCSHAFIKGFFVLNGMLYGATECPGKWSNFTAVSLMVAVWASVVTFEPCGRYLIELEEDHKPVFVLELWLQTSAQTGLTWLCNQVAGQIISCRVLKLSTGLFIRLLGCTLAKSKSTCYVAFGLFSFQSGWNVKDEYAVVVSPQAHCEYSEAQLLADAFRSLRTPLSFWWEAHGNTKSSWMDFTKASERSFNHFSIKIQQE